MADARHERPPVELLLDQVEMVPLPCAPRPGDELPYATHQGALSLGDLTITVYQLSDGQRVLDADDVARFLEAGFNA